MKRIDELGRTLMEMMAVLAIIGLLSAMGLQLYRKAIVKMYAQEAWASVFKFLDDARNYDRLHPGEAKAQYCSGTAALCGSYFPLEDFDILPTFAKGDPANFYVIANKALIHQQQGESKVMYIKNIRVDGLCSALFPGAKNQTSYLQIKKDDVTYRCYRANSKVKL